MALLAALQHDKQQPTVIHCEPIAAHLASMADTGVLHKPAAVSEACRRVFEECQKAAMQEGSSRLVVLGGDHSMAIGSVGGIYAGYLERKSNSKIEWEDPVLIWFDAHADINTLRTTRSGNIHGCPVAFLVDHQDTRGQAEFNWYYEEVDKHKARTGKRGFVDPKRLGYIGLRDVEDGELAIMEDLGITNAWFMEDINASQRDIAGIVKAILDGVDPEGKRPIHLSLDVDGTDPTFTPSTGTPVPNGLTLAETIQVVSLLRDTGRLFSVDVVEVNMLLGSEEDIAKTLTSTVKILQQIV